MRIAAQELEEFFSRAQRIGDEEARIAEVVLEIAHQRVDADLRPIGIEEAAETREPPALGDDDAVQFDRIGREHDVDHALGVAAQCVFRLLLENAFEIGGHDAVAEIGDHAGEKILLAAEMAVDRHLRDARVGGNVVHASSAEARLEERRLSAVQNRPAFGVGAAPACFARRSRTRAGARPALADDDTVQYRFLRGRRCPAALQRLLVPCVRPGLEEVPHAHVCRLFLRGAFPNGRAGPRAPANLHRS